MYSREPDGEEIIMSIAQGTTHYDYPQVQLNDRPTFADFNPAFSDIDAKLYGLITGAATDEQAIADLGTAVGNLTTDLGGVSDVATAAKNKADANEEAIGLLSTQVSQNTTKLGTKIDSNAIAEPYDTSATYVVGDVVTYQGQRYRCTTAVAVAEPFDATKWTGEDVQTVLESQSNDISQLNSALAANKINDRISLTSYTGSNYYVCNNDGYLFIGAGATDTDVSVTIQGAAGSTYSINVSVEYISGANGQSELIFIKKGMSIKCNGNYSSTSVMFYPLV